MLVMRTPVTRVLPTPKSTTHHALLPGLAVVNWLCLFPSLPLEASYLPYFELMKAGLPSAMFTSVVTTTFEMSDFTR